METLIEIEEMHKSFKSNHVLRGLNLAIRKGETIVIIGRSGCGKSVLLKNIIGILRPDSGRIRIDGTDILALKRREFDRFRMKIGMLFQGAALFDSLTVRENVGFSLYEHSNLSREEIDRIVEEKLRLVGLTGVGQLMPAELSGGMKKRVGLARAICTDPEIILYDEPTTGLDPIMADVINDLLNRLHNHLKVTSVVVTHDMKSAYKVADRIAMMYEGKIIGVGTPDQIKSTQDPVIKQFISGEAKGPITDREQKFMLGNSGNHSGRAKETS